MTALIAILVLGDFHVTQSSTNDRRLLEYRFHYEAQDVGIELLCLVMIINKGAGCVDFHIFHRPSLVHGLALFHPAV